MAAAPLLVIGLSWPLLGIRPTRLSVAAGIAAGGLVLAPFALAIEGAPPELDSDAVWGFAYLGLVGTGLAYVLWFRGIARLAATRVSLLGLFSPLVAVIIGVAFAGERFGAAEAVGVLLVLSGVLLGQRPQPEKRAPGEAAHSRSRTSPPLSTN